MNYIQKKNYAFINKFPYIFVILNSLMVIGLASFISSFFCGIYLLVTSLLLVSHNSIGFYTESLKKAPQHKEITKKDQSIVAVSEVTTIGDFSQFSTTKFFGNGTPLISCPYLPKLLYFKAGYLISAGITSTDIIYPFHCFT